MTEFYGIDDKLDTIIAILDRLVTVMEKRQAQIDGTYEAANQVEEAKRLTALLNTPIEELELSVRCGRALKNDYIDTIGQLLTKTDAELLRMPNFGRKSLTEIHEAVNSWRQRNNVGMLPSAYTQDVAARAAAMEHPTRHNEQTAHLLAMGARNMTDYAGGSPFRRANPVDLSHPGGVVPDEEKS